MRDESLPALDGLGRDLSSVGVARRAWSLAAPFLFAIAFFLLAARGLWFGALVCTMLLTFFTYGSISHDLVHGTLRLPKGANEFAGSWSFPFITSFIPHDPSGRSELTKTRLFRGRVLSIVAIEHLYHLEHHLYPQVPHHNWPELARRLDPYFTRAGLRPVKLFF